MRSSSASKRAELPRAGWPQDEANIELVLGNVCRYLCDPQGAIKHFEQSIALVPDCKEFDLACRLGDLSLSHSYNGNIREALRYGNEMLARAEASNDPAHIAGAHDALCLGCFLWGRMQDAIRHAEAMLAVWKKGMHDGNCYTLSNCGLAHFMEGRFDDAVAMLQRCCETTEEMQCVRPKAIALYNLALVHHVHGDVAEALRSAQEAGPLLTATGAKGAGEAVLALAAAAASGDRNKQAHALLSCARASARNPDLFPPRALAERAAETASQLGLAELARDARHFIEEYTAHLVLPEEPLATSLEGSPEDRSPVAVAGLNHDRVASIVQSYEEHPLRAETILDRIRRQKGSTDGLNEMDLAVDDETWVTDQNHPGGVAAVLALAKAVELGSRARVLDVGSGLGGPLRILARTYGCRCHGVELTEIRHRDAELLTRLVRLDELVTFTCGDFMAVQVPGGPFDLLIGQGAFNHFPDFDALFRKCASLISPGGWLAAEDLLLSRQPVGEEVSKLDTLCECWNGRVLHEQVWRRSLAGAGLFVRSIEDQSALWAHECRTLLNSVEDAGRSPIAPREILGWRLSAELLELGLIRGARLLARKSSPEDGRGIAGASAGRRPMAQPARNGQEQPAGLNVRAQGLSVALTNAPVLRNVDLELAAGEFLTIVGQNSCGKTTLLRTVAGLQAPTSGGIEIDGRPAGRGQRVPGKIAFVFQEPTLIPWKTTGENVRLPLEFAGLHRDEQEARVRQSLDQVGISPADGRKFPDQLAGGARMRASLARALVVRPGLLLLDEPFAAADEILRQDLNELLIQLWRDQGFSVIFVTHSITEAIFLAQRVLVFGPSPGRPIAEVAVSFGYPRSTALLGDPDFVALVTLARRRLRETPP